MPSKTEHLNKAKHNENSVSAFNIATTPYRDWVVIAFFYAAIHYIDAFLDAKHMHHRSHVKREDNAINLCMKPIWRQYRALKDASRDARYEFTTIHASEITTGIEPDYNAVKSFIIPYI